MSQFLRSGAKNQDKDDLSGSKIVCIQHSQLEQLLVSLERLTILEDIKKELFEIKQKIGGTNLTNIHEEIQGFGESITTLTNSVKPYMQHIQEERLQREQQSKVRDYKKKINKIWSDTLNKRKLAFFNKLVARGTAEHYADFLKKDVPFFPKKFCPKAVSGESEEEARLKINLAKNKVETEIGILQLRARKHEENMVNLDSKISEEIAKCEEPSIRELLQTLWAEDITKQEEISLEKWKKKDLRLASLVEKKLAGKRSI